MTCEKAGEVTAKTRSKFLQLGILLLRSKSTYFYYVVKVRKYLLYPSKQLYNPQQGIIKDHAQQTQRRPDSFAQQCALREYETNLVRYVMSDIE